MSRKSKWEAWGIYEAALLNGFGTRPHTLYFLRMSDGKPHPDAFSPTLPLDSLQFYPTPALRCLLLMQTGVRILLVVWDENDYGYGIVLDWRTGERGKASEPLVSLVLSVDDSDSRGGLPPTSSTKSSQRS